MPEKLLKKLNTRILPQWKICFVSALIIGFIAHFYKLTNWLPNWDSLVFRYDSQNMITLGRWFLPVVCSFSSFYDLPFLNGIINIVFHALGAVYILKIFDIRKSVTAFLIGGLVVSFPVVTSVMMYNYVADGYGIAFLLSVLSAWFMTKEKPKYIVSVILTALSTGIYQAYITVTIMLVLLKLIDETLFEGKDVAVVLKKALHFFFTGLLGMVLYSVLLKIILLISSAKLLDYQGINSTVALSNIDIPASLYVIKETFIKCFFDISEGINVYVALNAFVLIFTISYYIKQIIYEKLYKKFLNLLVNIFLSVMLIMGAGALAFINSDIDYHNLMLMGYFVFYLTFLILYERKTDKTEKHAGIKCWIILLTSLTIILNQVVISNVSYHKAQMSYERSYGVLIRIADRIDKLEDAEKCNKILVIGALENSEDYSVNLTPDITGITDGYIIRADDENVGQSVLCSALNDYCEKNYSFVSGEEKKQFLQKDEIKSMKKWPHKDCVTVSSDTIIIKLGDEGEN